MYNCREQHKRIKEPSRLESFKVRNGCQGRIQVKPRKVYENINFHSCYCDHEHHGFFDYMFMHEQYTKGLLPFDGSLMEQPNKVIEILQLIDKLKQEMELARQKEAEKAAKHGR